jgi:hypothetical protein
MTEKLIVNAIRKHGVPKLTWYSDPGHSWLQVPKTLVPSKSRTLFSQYSYEDRQYLYLEEDCDAVRFVHILRQMGVEYSTREVFHPEDSPVRYKASLKHPTPIQEHIEKHFTIIPVTG